MGCDLGHIAGAHEQREGENKGMRVMLIGAVTLVNRLIEEKLGRVLTTRVTQSLTFVRSSSETRWLGAIQTSHNFGF